MELGLDIRGVTSRYLSTIFLCHCTQCQTLVSWLETITQQSNFILDGNEYALRSVTHTSTSRCRVKGIPSDHALTSAANECFSAIRLAVLRSRVLTGQSESVCQVSEMDAINSLRGWARPRIYQLPPHRVFILGRRE